MPFDDMRIQIQLSQW